MNIVPVFGYNAATLGGVDLAFPQNQAQGNRKRGEQCEARARGCVRVLAFAAFFPGDSR
jgi:hypothetical protein